jgi:NinB protein
MKFYLDDEKQGLVAFRHAWAKCLDALKAGKQFQVEIKYKNRSNEQNEKFHAIIGDIAKQAQHMGAKWDAESWKRLLVWQFCKEKQIDAGKIVPSLDMTGVVQLGQQTRKFTKEQASEFVEFLLAWCADNGVTLNDC